MSTLTRADIERAGLVPGWNGEPCRMGERAAAYGTGQWRIGIIVKVTPTYVWVRYTAPTSGRVWDAKARRDGRDTALYVEPRQTDTDCSLPDHRYHVGPGNFSRCACGHGRWSDCHQRRDEITREGQALASTDALCVECGGTRDAYVHGMAPWVAGPVHRFRAR